MFSRENVLVYAQLVTMITLAVLVGIGKDSVITDAFLAIVGSLAGVGVWERFKSRSRNTGSE